MGNLSADEQKPHTRSCEWDEMAQHIEILSFSSYDKWGSWAEEVSVLTYGDLADMRC